MFFFLVIFYAAFTVTLAFTIFLDLNKAIKKKKSVEKGVVHCDLRHHMYHILQNSINIHVFKLLHIF